MPSWELQSKRRREAAEKFDRLVKRIRRETRVRNFLLPPAPEELMAAAALGPVVVVNLSVYRCDAFLVERDRIRILELPKLTLRQVQERAWDLRLSRPEAMPSTLEFLWDAVCGPCLESLGFLNPITDDEWPRVWWIPTGLLSQLPLHAAGYHTRGSTKVVLDRIMSSYALSIKTLIYGRRSRTRQPCDKQLNKALLLSMPKTPGMDHNGVLPYAEEEIKMLESLCPALDLQPIKTKRYKNDILQGLQACKIFHFAGHGRSDPTEPSQSCLLLDDWQKSPLTVADLREHQLQDNAPFLGYLSAYWTGANEVENLTDEVINLVSAFQLAGFRHVVGTLWEVSDRYCVDVARVLYETLRDKGMTDRAVCLGLHYALRSLRGVWIDVQADTRNGTLLEFGNPENSNLPIYWVPYIHYGI